MIIRDLKLFLKCLVRAGALFLLLALVCVFAAGVMMNTAKNDTTIKVAVTDNEDSAISRILVNAVANTEFLSSLLVAEQMDEAAAMESLKNGDSIAAIILPEGFIDDIMAGRESHGTVYLSADAASQAAVVKSSVRFGERLLLSGQYGVFAASDILGKAGMSWEEKNPYVTESNIRLLNEALSASSSYFDHRVLDFDGTGLSADSYYAVCWLTALLLLIALFFVPLFSNDVSHGMLARLRANGIGNFGFMWPKFAMMLALRAVLTAAAAVVLAPVFGCTVSLISVISSLLGAVFITAVSCAVTMCLGDGITGNVVVTVGGMFLCGGLVPRQLIPDAVAAIGDITPFGAAHRLIAPLFGAPFSWEALLTAAVYATISLALIRSKLNSTVSGRTR